MSTKIYGIRIIKFGKCMRGARTGYYLTASISRGDKFVTYRTGISHDITKIINEKGLNYMVVGVDDRTRRICIMFFKDYVEGALKIGYEAKRSSARIYNKELALYWKSQLCIIENSFCERIETSEDISESDEYAKFIVLPK